MRHVHRNVIQRVLSQAFEWLSGPNSRPQQRKEVDQRWRIRRARARDTEDHGRRNWGRKSTQFNWQEAADTCFRKENPNNTCGYILHSWSRYIYKGQVGAEVESEDRQKRIPCANTAENGFVERGHPYHRLALSIRVSIVRGG